MRWALFSVRRLITDIGEKLNSWVSAVPWRFSESGDPDEAAESMMQVSSKPLEEHDLATQDIVRRIGPDLEARAKGEQITAAPAGELQALDNIP